MKYLSPKVDLTFKKVFAEHKNLLISFLNCLLLLPDDELIVDVEYLTPEMVPDTPAKKDSVVDVRCTDQLSRQFIVEMQMYWTDAFKKRALLNTCKAYTRQVERGEKYAHIKPVYTLSLVDDIAFPNEESFYHRYLPLDVNNPSNKIEGFEMIFVELPKFERWQKDFGSTAYHNSPDNKVKISNLTFRKLAILWLRFLTEINEHTIEVDEDLLTDKDVSQALDLLRDSAYSDDERLSYDRYWDMVSRERTALDEKEEKGRAEGRAEGIAQGIAQGITQGIAQGITQGIAQGQLQMALQIAANMKSLNMSMDDIVKATGLSPEQIIGD